LRASWVVKTERAGEVVLVARVETFGHFRSPISVDLRMPEGVALVAGVPSVVLPPADAGAVREIELTFRFRSTPKEDLILVVDSQTPAAGVHAEDHYRFGRPAPERLQPAANGPAIRVGNLDFGRSVAVPPRDPAVAR
jgi:hypothetical protein